MSTLAEQIAQAPAEYAQESLIVDATEEIWRVMNDAGVNKTELATRLKCSKAHVTQMLNGQRNLTLRSLAEICYVLGMKANINIEPACKVCGGSGVVQYDDKHGEPRSVACSHLTVAGKA